MNVLITGGAGYIGSHTAKAMAKAGFKPISLDNMSFGHDWAVKWGPLEKGELGDVEFVRRVIKQHKIEAVIHFAANAFVNESMTNPRKYFQNNVVNTLNLLNVMNEENVKNIVFSSTCATYGDPIRVPIDESHPQNPVNPYGESKLFVEKMLKWYGGAYELKWTALRYFNAAGADPDGEIGEDHDPETHLIPLVIQVAMGQRPHASVFGTDYPTPDGSAIRDYIHVFDLADAHVKSLQRLLKGEESTYFNLGTGTGSTVRQVIKAVEKSSGKTIKVVEAGRRAGDPPALVADARKANTVLGWKPTYPQMETIVEHAWRWHSKHAATHK